MQVPAGKTASGGNNPENGSKHVRLYCMTIRRSLLEAKSIMQHILGLHICCQYLDCHNMD